MTAFLLGTKVGMTRFYTDEGLNIPVTVIQAGPCVVTQIKTPDVDGYAAIQLGYGDAKPRRTAKSQIAHDFKAGSDPRHLHREFRVSESDLEGYELGQEVGVSTFDSTVFVDVAGISRGKGFQGPMVRYGFKGQPASHGIKRVHRSPGSIGGHATNLGTGPKLKKGKRMAGHTGAERVTVRNLDVIKVDSEQNLLLVKGPVPGNKHGYLMVRDSVRLGRAKATKAAAAG
ncbi:MAG: 50S ribosomal protein L3 [Phycisphaerales bacterium]